MLQKIIIILTALAALVINMAQADTLLSTNPWVEANDKETISAIYQKGYRKNKHHPLNYQAEDTTTIDRTHAYIQSDELSFDDNNNENDGIMAKMKNIFNDEQEEPEKLIPATTANRQAIAKQRAQAMQQRRPSSKDTSFFNINKELNQLQKKIHLPKLPSANGLIQKFERASGINFKKIGRKL